MEISEIENKNNRKKKKKQVFEKINTFGKPLIALTDQERNANHKSGIKGAIATNNKSIVALVRWLI